MGNNLYETIRNELFNNNSFDLIEKCIYIFKRTCEMFNYDESFYSSDNFNSINSYINQKYDMTNIESRKIVCSGWSRLYYDLAEAILSSDDNYGKTIICTEDEHYYIMVITKDNRRLLLDPISPGDDFFNVSRGFNIRGIEYYDDNKSYNENKIYIEKVISKVFNDYSCNYLDYLKLVKNELEKVYNTKELNSISRDNLNKIFKYIIDTSNFKDLGLIESGSLILNSLLYIFGNIKSCGFKYNNCFNTVMSTPYVCLLTPKNEEDNELYTIKRNKDDSICIGKIKTLKKDEDIWML